ncbi:uncharacterized protein TNCV_2038911 [Trichonephila clavipes]|nr:uncharacterized protein TNCV_2038911 [Trichonephila clavipes]
MVDNGNRDCRDLAANIDEYQLFLFDKNIRSGIGGEREDDIEELIMGHENELTTEELQEILNEEYQETQRNVSPSEQEEDERGPMPTSAIKDLLKKWEDVRANGFRMTPIPS